MADTYETVAEYNGVKYSFLWTEQSKLQDVSSDEVFYYQMVVQPELGEKSPCFLGVFMIWDDTLCYVAPMKGVTPKNFDDVFERAIYNFEHSSNYEAIKDYHLDRAALEMERDGVKPEEVD